MGCVQNKLGGTVGARVGGVFLAEDRDGDGGGDGTVINVGQFSEAGVEVGKIFAFG